jgi:PAS domain S-box-containing protein/putative nucleotidyltransferase with HDIG domain
VNHEHVMAVLYDMAMVIGSEVDLNRLLTRTLQRLLFHASFPAGMLFLEVPPPRDGSVEARVEVAIGDYELGACTGRTVKLPAALLCGGAELCEDPALLENLPCSATHYGAFLRLPIDHYGVILLFAPHAPRAELPLTKIFRPVMENFAHAILLCRHYAAYTDGLVAERNFARADLERFRAAVDASMEIVLLVDPITDRFVDFNRAAERALGYSRDELLLVGPKGIDPSYNGGEIERLYESLQHRGAAERVFERVYRRKDGGVFPVEIRLTAFFAPDQMPLVIAVATDIGERKRTEAMRAELAAIVASSNDAIISRDLNGVVVSWNLGAEKMYGFTPAEMLGRPVNPIVPSGREAETTELFERVKRGEVVSNFETVRLSKAGRSIDVSLTLSPIRDVAGELTGVSTIARDITERHRAETALRHSEASLREAQRVAHVGSWELDAATDRIVASDETYRIFEVEPSDDGISYAQFLATVHPDDRERVDRACTDAAARRASLDVVHRIRARDGGIKYVRERAETVFDDAGRPLRMVGTAHDVTGQTLADLALHKVNRALKTLSSGNEVLVHAIDEPTLLNDMCRVIVEVGGYAIAWVGMLESDGPKRVRPAAYAGRDKGWLQNVVYSWGEDDGACEPARASVETRRPQLVNDTLAARGVSPCCAAATGYGLRSLLVLPLVDLAGVVFGLLMIHGAEPNAFDAEEVSLLEELADDLAYGIVTMRARVAHDLSERQRQEAQERLRASLTEAIQAIGATLEMRDPYTAGHQRQVAELAVAIAAEMDLPPERVEGIHFGALIHDIGKIQIPSEILSKPGRLTPIEYELIKNHAQAGYEILKGVQFPWPIAQMVLEHHERLDGSGYPQGLKGEQILLDARILAVADVVEAMSSHRPYRPTLGLDAALGEIRAQRGVKYDPGAVDACLRVVRGRKDVTDLLTAISTDLR